MGVVYRALDPVIGRIVAIKTIHLNSLTDQQDRERMHERLRREAQSAGILSHPNIVTIYDIQDHGDKAYIFMEFVDGPTLESITSDRRAPSPTTLLALLKQIAAALDFAHSKGIIHRDIKPANIMIQGERIAKVTDFGIARINAQASVSSGATVAGTLLGTPNYMSPEQIQGEAVDGRADQFSLGVLTYELLTGEKPFSADSIPALIYKIINQDPPPAERLNASLHSDAGAALARAMEKDREQRFPTCVEFVEALELGLARQPNWQPLPRGASDSAPTVASQPGWAATVIEPPARKTVVTPPPAPEPVLPPLPDLPEPRLRDDPDEGELKKGSRLLKVAGMAVAAALAIAAGVVFWAQNTDFAGTPPPVVESAPGDKTPPAEGQAPVATTPPEAKLPETKPPETKPVEPKPPEPAPVAKAPEPVTQPQSGGLQLYPIALRSQPDGATAVLESGRGCRTPCEIQVPAGRHTATFTAEGYSPLIQRFEVPGTDNVFGRLDANSGTVFVDSSPSGASIRVDGKDISARTPTSLTLPAGRHKIEFSKDGYPSQLHDVDVSDGAISKLSIRWSEKK
jgi:serine/threonine-protein kinase